MTRLSFFSTLILSLTALVGCDEETGGDKKPTGGLCMPSTIDADSCSGDGSTFYVINVLDVARETPPMSGTADGFNLDCRTDAPCTCENDCSDFTSSDSTAGIDNQFARLEKDLETTLMLSENIKKNINEGDILILVELTGLDTTDVTTSTNDDCVGVNIYFGVVPGFGAPELDGEKIKAGQTFDINSDAVDMGGDPLVRFGGTIENGRLSAGPSTIPLDISVSGRQVKLTIQDGQLETDLTDGIISNGLIGGVLDVEDSVKSIEMIEGLESVGTLLKPVFQAFADMNPNDEGVCTAVSAAIAFSGVDAVRGNIVDKPDNLDGGVDGGN